ncbi:MAG TPA: hypothetical protein VLZ30_04805, partial [Verrucomicrobiae bacterium]|nr:hypothetical protein [Verrucomicrobiae bacterium]
PANATPVVLYNTFLCGLPFYLGRTVQLCRPHAADKKTEQEPGFDFRDATQPGSLSEPQFHELFAGPRRVFGVGAIRRVDQLQATWGEKLYLLERAGPWVLFSNQPAP